jgi:DNA replication and repair protein RecF
MKIENIKSWNFRGFKQSDYSFSKGINIICGNNATGKTSILEQIYVLCLSKSHRSKKDADLISFGEEYLVLKGSFNSADKNLNLQLSISNKGKIAKIGLKEIKNLSSYIGTINVVLFCPEDLMIVKGSPSDRRKFIDVEMGQISSTYLKDLIEYRDLLKQRNATLKELSLVKERDKYYLLLSIIDEKIIITGCKIIQSRTKFIELINEISIRKMNAISSSNDQMHITYNPSVSIELFKDQLKLSIESDIVRGSTSVGPHRDDFSIQINERDVSVFGSQGQQRSVVLALKLSLLELISKMKKEMPILLLDDVFSELDEKRQNEIMKLINMGAQTFITTTTVQEIDQDILRKSKVIYLTKENSNEGKQISR